MADDFEDDPNTPTEADLNECYGGKYLNAADIGDRKIRTRIVKLRRENVRQQDGTERPKAVAYFANVDKPMVLNFTNKEILVEKLGAAPSGWIGPDIGLLTEPTKFAGKPTKGLRLRVLGPVKKQPPPQPTQSAAPPPQPPPKPPQTAAEPPFDDPDDPGAMPDSDRDFGEAAE